MKMRPLKCLVALISLLAFLLTGQAGGSDDFWCLGEDGRTALESISGDGCGSGQREHDSDCHSEEPLTLSLQEEFCGPCLDLPAFSQSTSSKHHHKLKNVQILPEPGLARALTVNLYPQPPPRTSKSLLSHRTVVLLI